MSEEKFGFTTVRSKSFTFTHKIGEFSKQLYSDYYSPKYYSEMTCCNWSLAVTEKGGKINIFLQREDFAISCQELDIKLWIVDQIGLFPFCSIEERKTVKFSPKYNSESILCVSKNDLFFKNLTFNRLRFVPRDTLTVKCQITTYDSVSKIFESKNQSEESSSVDMKTEFCRWILGMMKSVLIWLIIISTFTGIQVSEKTWNNKFFGGWIMPVIILVFIFSLMTGGIILIYHFCLKPFFLQIVLLMQVVMQTVIPSGIVLAYAIFIFLLKIKTTNYSSSKFFKSNKQSEKSLSIDLKTKIYEWISWKMKVVFGYLIIGSGLIAYQVSKITWNNEFIKLTVLVIIFIFIFSLLIGGIVLIYYFCLKPFCQQIVLLLQVVTPPVISAVLLAYAIVIFFLSFRIKETKSLKNRNRLMSQSRQINEQELADLIDLQSNRSIMYVTED